MAIFKDLQFKKSFKKKKNFIVKIFFTEPGCIWILLIIFKSYLSAYATITSTIIIQAKLSISRCRSNGLCTEET